MRAVPVFAGLLGPQESQVWVVASVKTGEGIELLLFTDESEARLAYANLGEIAAATLQSFTLELSVGFTGRKT